MEDEEANWEDGAVVEPASPGRRLGRLLGWTFALLLLVGLGAGGWYLYGVWQNILQTVPRQIVQSILPELIGDLNLSAIPVIVIVEVTATPLPTAARTSAAAAALQATRQALQATQVGPTASPTAPPAIAAPPTEIPPSLVLGGADKIAFLHENEIWIANLDGTRAERLTEDGLEKERLQWTPDGQYLLYWNNGMLRGFDPVFRQTQELGRIADLAI